MNQTALIKRAWHIMRRYPVLWIFGILVALTSGGGGGGGGSGFNFNSRDLNRMGGQNFNLPPELANFDPGRYAGLALACCCLVLILALLAVIISYVARTALLRGVDQIEDAGAAPTWHEGLRLGWSNRSFRLFLLELLVGIVVGVIALLLLAVGASPLLLLLTGNEVARVIGIVLTVGMELLIVLALLVVTVLLSILGQFWAREIALADRSVGDALATGYATVRGRLKDLGLMWLLLLGVSIVFAIVMIPIVLLVGALALALGGGLGYGVYLAFNSVVWAVVAGLPIFIVVFGIPMAFVQGLYTVFTSSTWTLAYREVVAQK